MTSNDLGGLAEAVGRKMPGITISTEGDRLFLQGAPEAIEASYHAGQAMAVAGMGGEDGAAMRRIGTASYATIIS